MTADVGAGRRPPAPASTGALIRRRVLASRRFRLGVLLLAVLAVWSVAGGWLVDWTPDRQDLLHSAEPPSARHWFGTDRVGHDVYVQCVEGLRKSLIMGVLAGPLATLLATVTGTLAGYAGGIVDAAVDALAAVLLVVPPFLVLFLLSDQLRDRSWLALVLVIPLFSWMVMAHVVRAQTSSLRQRDFVAAARYQGVGPVTVIRRHIVPHLASLLVVDATLSVVAAVMAETSLSYFGFGVRPPDVSLGSMLATGQAAIASSPWLFLAPASLLVTLLVAVGLMGDALRDAIDPTATRAAAPRTSR